MNPAVPGAWFHADAARRQHGPFSTDELVARFRTHQLDADTLIWRDGLTEWQPLRMLADELGLLSAEMATATSDDTAMETMTAGEASPPLIWNSDQEAETAHVATPLDPYAAPQAAVFNTPRAVSGGEVVLAGFWKRAAAYFIDYFLLAVVGAVAGAMLGAVSSVLFRDGISSSGGALLLQAASFLLSCAISACYFGWFHASPQQASLGKMAIGIKVVRGDGEAVTFLRGVARYLGLLLSSLLLCIGFLMAAFTRRKQALHDVMCDTLVVDKWAFTAYPERQRHELGALSWVILILGGLFVLAVLAIFGLAAVAAFGGGF